MTQSYFEPYSTGRRTRTLSVTSGKGGVGKSSVAANLALDLAARGQKVLILDGDLGMANLDVLFGHRSNRNIQDVINGKCPLSEIIYEVDDRVSLIPGGSGIYGLSRVSNIQKQILLDQVSELNEDYSFMIIDTAPGIEDHVLYLNAAVQETLVVATPDPASITDAYALIKVLNQRYGQDRFSVLVNMVKSEEEALRVFRRISDVALQFLNIGLDYRGSIPMDLVMRQSTKTGQLVRRAHPYCESSQAIRQLSEKLCLNKDLGEVRGGIQFFWQQVSGVA